MLDKITTWIGNIYNTHGWMPALVVLVVLFAMALITVWLVGTDEIGRWFIRL